MSGSRRKPGPLGPFVDGYRAWLVGRGYSPSVVVRSLVTLGHLGRWLERNALAVDQLTAEPVSSFLAEYRVDRGRLPGASVWPLLEYLRAEGAVAPEPPAVVAPVAQLVGAYPLRRAGTEVHEPIHRFQLEIPADALGSVLPVVAQLAGVPAAPAVRGATCTIDGEIPRRACTSCAAGGRRSRAARACSRARSAATSRHRTLGRGTRAGDAASRP
jgi:hypothetical protein